MHYLINFSHFGSNEVGYLVPIEDISFDIKRMFYIYNVPNHLLRGVHYYYKTKQILVCLGGSMTVKCNNKEYTLNNPKIALYLEPEVWREAYGFSEGAILLALCSEKYDENDYRR